MFNLYTKSLLLLLILKFLVDARLEDNNGETGDTKTSDTNPLQEEILKKKELKQKYNLIQSWIVYFGNCYISDILEKIKKINNGEHVDTDENFTSVSEFINDENLNNDEKVDKIENLISEKVDKNIDVLGFNIDQLDKNENFTSVSEFINEIKMVHAIFSLTSKKNHVAFRYEIYKIIRKYPKPIKEDNKLNVVIKKFNDKITDLKNTLFEIIIDYDDKILSVLILSMKTMINNDTTINTINTINMINESIYEINNLQTTRKEFNESLKSLDYDENLILGKMRQIKKKIRAEIYKITQLTQLYKNRGEELKKASEERAKKGALEEEAKKEEAKKEEAKKEGALEEGAKKERALEGVKAGAKYGALEGVTKGAKYGVETGFNKGDLDRAKERANERAKNGANERAKNGANERDLDRASDGAKKGASDGASDGAKNGALDGASDGASDIKAAYEAAYKAAFNAVHDAAVDAAYGAAYGIPYETVFNGPYVYTYLSAYGSMNGAAYGAPYISAYVSAYVSAYEAAFNVYKSSTEHLCTLQSVYTKLIKLYEYYRKTIKYTKAKIIERVKLESLQVKLKNMLTKQKENN